MPVVDEFQLPGVDPQHERVAKQMLATAAWGWFDQHRDDVVYKVRVWVVKVDVKVWQLEPVFTKIFGAR